ncbi:MAG: N-acetylmannosamine-6-phosphate 2-epimerase [Methanocella sp.]
MSPGTRGAQDGENVRFAEFREAVQGRLIVSCQALPGTPMADPAVIAAVARSVELAGAAALRLAGAENIAAVRPGSTLPIIGIYKTPDRSQVYITPDFASAQAVVAAGADVVALQATEPRTANCDPLPELIARIHAELGVPVMADVATLAEGRLAMAAGADLVATTLSGYTPTSLHCEDPDLDLVSALASAGFPVIAEGRYRTPEQVTEALRRGAFAVVVGTFITMPDRITRYFLSRLERLTALGDGEVVGG